MKIYANNVLNIGIKTYLETIFCMIEEAGG